MSRWSAIVACLVLLLAFAIAPSAAKSNAPDPTSVRRDLHDILSRSEYHRGFVEAKNTDGLAERLDRLRARIGKWLMDHIDSNKQGDRAARVVLAMLVVAAFIALVVLIARKLWGLRMRGNAPEESIDFSSYQLPSAAPLIKEAGRLAQAGDYRAAFRCAYLASISHLDEARALRFERSRTNWEYVRELASGGHQAPHDRLRPLTITFDRKFYGGEGCSREDYEAALDAYERISGEVAA